MQGSDYVGAFAVEGKLHNVMNLWRGHDVYEDDDLVLELREMKPQPTSLILNLSSSVRAQRSERCCVTKPWFYLDPVPLKFKTITDVPHIHIGRSQKMINAYAQHRFGLDMPPWNARACVLGLPLVMTFEPCFRPSDEMLLNDFGGGDGETDDEQLAETIEFGGTSVTTLPAPAADAMQQVLPTHSHTFVGQKKRRRENPSATE